LTNHQGEAPFAEALLRTLGYRTRIKRVSDDVYYDAAKGPLAPGPPRPRDGRPRAGVPLVTLKELDIVSRRVGNYRYNPQLAVLLDRLWIK
jgi:hypothetical protein